MKTISPELAALIDASESVGVRIGAAAALPDGTRVAYRADELFKSASTIKIAIMIELFRKIDAGELSLNQPYVLSDADKSPGSGVLQQLHTGIKLTLRDVVYLMMSISDNPATNILINLVGLEAVNHTMREFGLTESTLGRPMRGVPSQPGEPENLAVPSEFVTLIERILDGTAASAESCFAMMELMQTQQNDRRIGRFVPRGTVWGSKTGTVGNLVADAGYIMTQDGPLVVAVYVDDAPDMVEAEIIISSIVRLLLTETGEAID